MGSWCEEQMLEEFGSGYNFVISDSKLQKDLVAVLRMPIDFEDHPDVEDGEFKVIAYPVKQVEAIIAEREATTKAYKEMQQLWKDESDRHMMSESKAETFRQLINHEEGLADPITELSTRFSPCGRHGLQTRR